MNILPPTAIQVAVKEAPSVIAGNTNECPNSVMRTASTIVTLCTGTETQIK